MKSFFSGYGNIHARSTDPATSHDAVPDNISAQAWRVLHAYKFGRALTDHDAYRLVGLPDKLARQRCSDLRRWKMIERTGERGRTPSGKSGYLCKITAHGTRWLNSGGYLFHESDD